MSAFLTAARRRFRSLEPYLNALDAATGDGDHGTVMFRGLEAAADNAAHSEQSFRRATGAASGAMFAVLVGALERIAEGAGTSETLKTAAERIALMGGAHPGDKTMLDALLPAIDAKTPASAARQGAESTRAMVAQKGRARYVEGAGVGHLDAGAVSVAELLWVLREVSSENCETTPGKRSRA